jgi:hypothetical protein
MMATKKRTHKKVGRKKGKRRGSATTRATSAIVKAFAPSKKLPALSTLVKMPVRHLQSGVKRYETALDVKQSPGMFSKSGKRLFIGPRKSKSRRQRLPKEIAHLFP